MRITFALCLAGGALGWAGSLVHGSAIGGNFCSVARIFDDPAGVEPAANWNDLTSPAGYAANDSKANLIYSDGSVAVGTTATWNVSEGGSQNTNDEVYRPRPPASLGLDIDDGHDQMMAGYLQASKNSANTPWITLKVTGLDVAAFGGAYSIILYSDGDDDIASTTGAEQITLYSSVSDYLLGNPQASYYGRDKTGVNYSVDSDGTNPASVYKQIVSTNPLSPTEGNYIRFDGLTGSEFVVRLSGIPGVHGAALNGFQIVAPEPASLALLGIGGLGLLLHRRR